MHEHDAFLDTICARPDDDLPRLIYADYLEDQGDPAFFAQAEFIRLQIRRANLSWNDPIRDGCLRREQVLWNCYGNAWTSTPQWAVARRRLRSRKGVWDNIHWEFDRGFVSRLSLTVEDFLQTKDHLFQALPVRDAIFRPSPTARELIPALADSPKLRHLRRLRLAPPSIGQLALGDQGLAELLQSPHLSQLISLDLDRQLLTDRSMEILQAWPGYRRLRVFRLAQNRPSLLCPEPVRGLALAEFFQRTPPLAIEQLHLENVVLSPQDLERLAQQHLPHLQELALNRAGVNEMVLSSLGRLHCWPALIRFQLRNNRLDPEAASEFRHASWLRQIRSLDLASNQLRDLGVARLVTCTKFEHLEQLVLRKNRLGPYAARALVEASHLTRLRSLDLSHNHLGQEGTQLLARPSRLTHLQLLDVRKNALSNRERHRLREEVASFCCRV